LLALLIGRGIGPHLLSARQLAQCGDELLDRGGILGGRRTQPCRDKPDRGIECRSGRARAIVDTIRCCVLAIVARTRSSSSAMRVRAAGSGSGVSIALPRIATLFASASISSRSSGT
jgi:hypothetical protein